MPGCQSRPTQLTLVDPHVKGLQCQSIFKKVDIPWLSCTTTPNHWVDEWIYHLKLCVVLHELLFSTQRHHRWIFTLQPLSHSVPFAHVTGCRVVSELRRCHIVRVQEPSTTRPTRVLIVNQVQRLCAFVLNKLEAFWSWRRVKNFDWCFKLHALRLAFGGRAGDVSLLQWFVWREHYVFSFVKFLVDFSGDVVSDWSIIWKTFGTQVFRIIWQKFFVKTSGSVCVRVEKASLDFNQQPVYQSDASGLSLSSIDVCHSKRVNVMSHCQPILMPKSPLCCHWQQSRFEWVRWNLSLAVLSINLFTQN